MKKQKHLSLDKTIKVQSLEKVMADRFKRFAKYNIQDRALPDARDGLKPVQRRILFSMYELGLFHEKQFKKSARVVGEVIGKYHPHGDSSIYEALIRMAQEWKMNYPLIEVHGNKGSIDDDPAAAMRYTETRLSALAFESLINLNKNTVPFAPNFDDSEQEPTVLPGLLPNLLINGSVGIASGYATEMPPHNLGEVLDGIIALIKSPNLSLDNLMQIIKGPDFPTGGIVQGIEGIKQAFETGQGRILIRSKIATIIDKNQTFFKITQIPYGVVKIRLIKQINDLIYDKKIVGIKEVRDESDREHGVQVVVELDKNANTKTILDYLLAKTDLQVYYHYNNVVIQNREPKQLGLIGLINAYLDHQREIQTLALQYDLTKAKNRLEIVTGLIKAKLLVNEIIELIKTAEGSKQTVVNLLITKLKFSPLQADAIAELKLYRLSKTDQTGFENEQTTLSQMIQTYELLLKDQNAFNNYLIKLLLTLKSKYKIDRKSIIEKDIEKITINQDQLIKHERVWLGISREGYLKRFSTRVYEANELLEYGLKEQDNLIYFQEINTVDKILLFTSGGRFIFIPAHKIEEFKWKDIGKHVNDFALINPEETIVNAIVINDFNLPSYITLVTKLGKGKRVLVKDFAVTRFSKTIVAIKLSSHDQLINAILTPGDSQLVLISKNNRAWRYPETELPVYGLNSSGVKAASLGHHNYLNGLTFGTDDTTLGLISSRGGLKRMRLSSFMPTNKNTQGRDYFKQIKSQPHFLLTINQVESNTKLFILTSQGYQIYSFKKTEITDSQSSFSLGINKPIISCGIMTYQRLDLNTLDQLSLTHKPINKPLTSDNQNQLNNQTKTESDQSFDLPSLDEILNYPKK